MGRQAAVALYVLALVAVVVSVEPHRPSRDLRRRIRCGPRIRACPPCRAYPRLTDYRRCGNHADTDLSRVLPESCACALAEATQLATEALGLDDEVEIRALVSTTDSKSCQSGGKSVT